MTKLFGSDWERVIIVHTQDPSSGDWAPSRALFSSHSSYHYYNWNDIQNTLSYASIPHSQVFPLTKLSELQMQKREPDPLLMVSKD